MCYVIEGTLKVHLYILITTSNDQGGFKSNNRRCSVIYSYVRHRVDNKKTTFKSVSQKWNRYNISRQEEEERTNGLSMIIKT